MFVAIVMPGMKESKAVLVVVLLAVGLSCLFYYVPLLSAVSSGLAISICAIVAALAGAAFFPVKEEA